MDDLCGEPFPVTVTPDAEVDDVVDRFVDDRGSSVVVVDDERSSDRTNPGRRPRRRAAAPQNRVHCRAGASRELRWSWPRRARRDGAPRLRSRVRSRLSRVLAVLGPGLIAANAGNDAGGIATYASAGAQYGYRTLFVMVLVTVALVVVQEMSRAPRRVHGRGPRVADPGAVPAAGRRIRRGLPRSSPTWASSSRSSPASAPRSSCSASPATSRCRSSAVAIWAIVVFGSYRYAERVFLVLSLVFITYPIAMILGHPDWEQVVSQSLVPHLAGRQGLPAPRRRAHRHDDHAVHAAVPGGGRRRPRHRSRRLPDERIDSVGGSIFAMFISISIIIATAAAIGGTGPLDVGQGGRARHSSRLSARRRRRCSASVCSVRPHSRPRSSRCRRPTRWRRRSGSSARCRGRFAEAPLFLGLVHRRRSSSAPPSRWLPGTSSTC